MRGESTRSDVVFEIRHILSSFPNPTFEDLRSRCLLREGEIDTALPELERRGFLIFNEGRLQVSREKKVKLAVLAIRLGAGLQKISKLLTWQEFESMIEYALIENEYRTKTHHVINFKGNRREIDVIAAKGDTLLVIDCKHYTHERTQHSLKKAARAQIERVRLLSDYTNLSRVESVLRHRFRKEIFLIPIIASLRESSMKIHERVPIVPVVEFASFLNELDGLLGSFGWLVTKADKR
ncbi:MAG: NERD domain-containing protein [Candidatus Bathyarchaeia archaeon]